MYKTEQNRVCRICYLDRLRSLAAFAVVFLHVSAQNWHLVDVSSFTWAVFNIYDSAVRWAVPVFVMVSGTIFLNREIPIKVIFTKYIFRILIAYFFWSFIYAVAEGGGVGAIVKKSIIGHAHMWYITMLIGLYISIPIYRQIVKHDGTIRYFLGISLLVSFLVPHLVLLMKDFGPDIVVSNMGFIESRLDMVMLSMMLGYSFYFILGYYLNKTEFSRKQRWIIYAIGCVGFFMTAFTSHLATQHMGSAVDHYYGEFTLYALVQSIAVFVFCKYQCKSQPTQNRVWQVVSKASFGIYWVHMLLLEQLDKKLMINTLSFFPVLSVPIISLIIFALSFAISWAIGRMPFLKRYVV